MADQTNLDRELEAARSTIAAQAVQIHRLELEAAERSGISALRTILELSDVAAVTVGLAPFRALLEAIISAASRLFDASAASIMLLDRDTNELVFEAATGAGGEALVGMRFPAHQGIAGWVMMTGEPLAVSDVQRDPRFAKAFAESTGYIPRSILAAPLVMGEEVEGVLEVLDKVSSASLGLEDMDLLALFARPAALAVEQARMVTNMGAPLVAELSRLAEEQGQTELAHAAQTALSAGLTVPDQTMELARLAHTLGRRGERTRQLAADVLASVVRYTS